MKVSIFFTIDALKGFNVTLLAYGQTSSGKTHTVEGKSEDPGILPRLAEALFSRITESDTTAYLVTVHFLEVYCGKIYDLLWEEKADKKEGKKAGKKAEKKAGK